MPGSSTNGHALGRLYLQQQYQTAAARQFQFNMAAAAAQNNTEPRGRIGTERTYPTLEEMGGYDAASLRRISDASSLNHSQTRLDRARRDAGNATWEAEQSADVDEWEADQNLQAAQQRQSGGFMSAMSRPRVVGGGAYASTSAGRNRFRPAAGSGGLVAQNIRAAGAVRRQGITRISAARRQASDLLYAAETDYARRSALAQR